MNKPLRTLTMLILTVFFISSCSDKYNVADNGFDKICLIYIDVFNNQTHSKKPLMDKHELVGQLIKAHVRDVDAITAFSAVANADPSLKYDLFKQSAEYSIKRDWDCEIIKNIGK